MTVQPASNALKLAGSIPLRRKSDAGEDMHQNDMFDNNENSYLRKKFGTLSYPGTNTPFMLTSHLTIQTCVQSNGNCNEWCFSCCFILNIPLHHHPNP